jgi:tetratricopeptide (TPR) repeat protein
VFLNRLGKFDAALKKARDAMHLNPDYPDAHCVAGYALQGLEDHEAAVREYQKAVELKPDYVEALVNIGNAYLELDRGLEAVTPLRRAIELMPECLQAHDFLGVAYFKTGDPQGAAEQFQILRGLDSTFEGSLSKLLSTEKSAADDGKRTSNGPSRPSD